MSGATLSDSWYQVAHARVGLPATVRVQAQRYRGQAWVTLEDPYTNRFFRVTPQAYGFLKQLTPERTIDEIWHELAARNPGAVPGQDEVVRLLSQLHLSSLLYFREAPHNDAIFDRARTQARRELVGKLMSFLFVRIPLVSPDRWLDRIRPLIHAMTGPAAGLLWLAVVLAGAVAAFEHRDGLSVAGEGLLSLSNLPWLYLSLTLVKVLHELSHAFVCKRFGGQVPTLGLMLLVMAPLPYVDASASWAIRSKWQRAYVGAAGMLAELFMAAVGALVWSATGEGLLHSLAFNVMVVGSVSSLLFNGNPLLRFDAYYILSDLVEMPNLYQKAQAQWLHYGNRWILGRHDPQQSAEPATDRTERIWFTVYGALAFAYRMLVTLGILMFVTDQWFGVGLVLLVTTAAAMLFMPLRKLWAHLRGPALRRGRARAWAGLASVVVVLYLLLAVVPVPYAVRLPGVLEARRSTQLYTPTAGVLRALPVRHGQLVREGQLIATLENADLDNQQQITRLQLTEAEALQRQALSNAPAEVAPLQSRIEALRARQTELQSMADQLQVRAPQGGEWVAPALHERFGGWIERGQPLGEVVDRSRFRFSAVLPQSLAAELFGQSGLNGELRLISDRGHALAVDRLELVPFQKQRLVSPVLGFSGGGDVAVRPDDATGTTTTEAFFELHAELADPALAGSVAYHGLSGVLRVPVSARPLATRVIDALQRLLQQRYGL